MLQGWHTVTITLNQSIQTPFRTIDGLSMHLKRPPRGGP